MSTTAAVTPLVPAMVDFSRVNPRDLDRLTALFYGKVSKQDADRYLNELRYAEGNIWQEVLSISRKNGKEEVSLYLLTHFQGQSWYLREEAAKFLAPEGHGVKQWGNIAIRRKRHKSGEKKFSVFHLSPMEVLGSGGNNKAELIREEVFGKRYKDKKAVLKSPNKLNTDATGDAFILYIIKEINGGTMPEGICKPPKVILDEREIVKYYNHIDLTYWCPETLNQLLHVMKGPIQALLFLRTHGIVQCDIAVENLFVETKNGDYFGALGDFDQVLACLPIDFSDPVEAKKRAQRALTSGLKERSHFYTHKNTITLTEYRYLKDRLLQEIYRQLNNIAKGIPVNQIAFQNLYQLFQDRLEKFQVMQMGVVLGRRIVNDFGDYLHTDENFITTFDRKKFKAYFFHTYGTTPLTEALFNLIDGMLRIFPEARLTAREVNDQFQAILQLSDESPNIRGATRWSEFLWELKSYF